MLPLRGSFSSVFSPNVYLTGALGGGDSLVDGEKPSAASCYKDRPLAAVSVAGTKKFLQDVFKALL